MTPYFSLYQKFNKSVYEEVRMVAPEDDLDSEYSENKPAATRPSWFPKLSTVLLLILVVFFAFISLYLSAKLDHVLKEQHRYSTDWAPARKSVKMTQQMYTSTFRFNDSSDSVYNEYGPNDTVYTGEPSPEIDEAWHTLLKGQYLLISEEEAMKLDRHGLVEGDYMVETEVMHSLHCLNSIRKALRPDYYPPYDATKLPGGFHETHLNHCIEQIRQNIQCALDLTPVPLLLFGRDDHQLYIGKPQMHTCRDWDSFRQWYTEKGEEIGNVDSSAS